ncbi:MAG: hypothetical protein CMK46_00735 [Porticoccus sp.]|nr:hypothetical protein [Porticoccus sp.]
MKSFSSDTGIQKIKLPEAGRIEFSDAKEGGLILRVSPRGKTWYLIFRPPGVKHPRRIKIGPYGSGGDGSKSFGLLQARRKAQDWKESLRAGDDPRSEANAAKARMKTDYAGTVERFLTQYVERNLARNTYLQYSGILRSDLLKTWRSRPIHKITRADVISVLDDIAESGRLVQANRTLAVLRKFFGWCAEKDLIPVDGLLPTDRVKPPLKKEQARKRTLSDPEIMVFWRACGQLGSPFGVYFQFLLATGQRRSEAANMVRSDIKEGVWTQTDNKAGRTHLLPLSDLAQSLLEKLPRAARSKLYFTTNDKTPIQGQSKVKQRLDAEIHKLIGEDSELFQEPWQIHDLRRTFTTRLRQLGIGQDVCSSLLNHAAKGVTAQHYDQYQMMPEKSHAMKVWGSFLESLLSDKCANVIGFNRA